MAGSPIGDLPPKGHAFRYRIGLLYLDLSEQEQVLGLSPFAGRGRFAPFSLRQQDYLPELTRDGTCLTDAVRQVVSTALGHTPQGAVCLLTQVRSWGLAFNPVSFFYCFEADGQLAAIVCEVTNTPWLEGSYHYVLPARAWRAASTSISRWPRRFMCRRSCPETWNTA